ncbi:MAG: malto-oligosyltrehalose synthase, partial [Chloroflexi bacterium]|nr:malto-oligosyltrehalose synthase [Chloroflexota bacterium]
EDRVEPHDQEQVLRAVEEARKREPALSREAFDYLRDVLLLKYPGSRGENSRSRQRSFVMRFQQVSSAVMAKGMEDTAFYRYFPLISVNEVGGTMGDFGCSVAEFHDANKRRLSDQPFSMISTATHDSKRGEDVRARINVLSEIPGEWQDTLERWSEINKQAKTLVDGEMMPDANTEYLVYQMLLGTYVLQMDQVDADNYERRIKEYIAKAAREANRHTNWVNPNQRYEQALFSFVSALLRRSPDNLFLADFLPLARLISVCGIYNSLSQLTLKIFSPGNPDFYQGTELWDCSLVDPDNRRPVNFDKRAELLARLEERAASASGPGSLIAELVGGMGSGMIKLFVTWKGLDFRRRHGALFYSGSYRPLAAEGQAKDNICAFSWLGESKELIICVPRLVERIVGERLEPVVGAPFWSGTHLLLGDSPGAGSFSNIFTGESIQCGLDSASVSISDLFKSFPVAALVRPH